MEHTYISVVRAQTLIDIPVCQRFTDDCEYLSGSLDTRLFHLPSHASAFSLLLLLPILGDRVPPSFV